MNRTLLLVLGMAALGGGAYYLYKSGKLVGAPGGEMAASSPYYGTPTYMPLQTVRANIQMPKVY